MLNGAKTNVTNLGGYASNGLDHPDQVKVKLYNVDPDLIERVDGFPYRNSLERFKFRLTRQLEQTTKHIEYGLECYHPKPSLGNTASKHPDV